METFDKEGLNLIWVKFIFIKNMATNQKDLEIRRFPLKLAPDNNQNSGQICRFPFYEIRTSTGQQYTLTCTQSGTVYEIVKIPESKMYKMIIFYV